jgi:aspartate oxidase
VDVKAGATVGVVGSGAAGLMAAAVAAERVPVALLTDRGLGTSNSAVAQGGLQVPSPGADALQRFIDDIRRSARTAVDETRLARFASQVVPTVELLQAWGLELDRDEAGELRRRRAGGLSEPRIVTAGDQIGPAVMKVLRHQVERRGVDLHTQTTVRDIVPCGEGLVLVTDTARLPVVACVVATGGLAHRRAFDAGIRTSNPANRNDVLWQSLLRLGLVEVGKDDYQYQPFGIVDEPRNTRSKCVPESIGGLDGVALVDRAEKPVIGLSADRREVTAAMFAAAAAGRCISTATGEPALRLTLSNVPSELIADMYPRLHRQLVAWGRSGADLAVWPFLHYQLGGFATGADGETAVPGLYLAGEMTGGLHGRNRLMGNGITDALVLGRLAGAAAASYATARGS